MPSGGVAWIEVSGYFWVPGTWVQPPQVGLLWTPGYWGFIAGAFAFHSGYWGHSVGFYGGVNYGFGYVGRGYQGGYWHGNDFNYNRSVNNISNVHITNVYNRTIINNTTINRVSYNGGSGGIQARPSVAEVAAYRAPHAGPMTSQLQLQQQAQANRGNFYNTNHGKPAEVAVARPLPAQIIRLL